MAAPKAKAKPKESQTEVVATETKAQPPLNESQVKILRALASGDKMSYRDIEKKVGLYKTLTKLMRARGTVSDNPNSLGARGLIKEGEEEISGKKSLFFTITAKGKKYLEKLDKPEKPAKAKADKSVPTDE